MYCRFPENYEKFKITSSQCDIKEENFPVTFNITNSQESYNQVHRLKLLVNGCCFSVSPVNYPDPDYRLGLLYQIHV